MFSPFDAWNCPIDVNDLDDSRVTVGTYQSGASFQRTETWRNSVQAVLPQPEPWIGKTIFNTQT